MTISEILAFFDDAGTSGTLEGAGDGPAAAFQMDALRDMIESAGFMITYGATDEAIIELQGVADRCDGTVTVPDYVVGPGISSLNTMLGKLITQLGG